MGPKTYSKGAREPQSTTPEGRGVGGGAPPRLIVFETTGTAFVAHAVEAVGATHGILAAQVVEGVARAPLFLPGGLLHKQGPRRARLPKKKKRRGASVVVPLPLGVGAAETGGEPAPEIQIGPVAPVPHKARGICALQDALLTTCFYS
jgi:hypothetical protein